MVAKLEVQKVYNLSPMQEGMLFHSLLEEESLTYFEQISFILKGSLELKLFEESLNHLVQRYDILRTNFIHVGVKKPQQVVLKNRRFNIHFEDISTLNENEMYEIIHTYQVRDKDKKFDLTKDMLMRIAVFKTGIESHKIIWSFHHILMDGWCIGIFFKELFQIYSHFKKNEPLKLENTNSYSEFIQWLGKQNHQEAYEYWKTYLEEYEQKAGLPQKSNRNEGTSYKHREIRFSLDEETTKNLTELAQRNHVTFNTVFQTIWSIMLQRYNNRGDVIFGSVVSGRPPVIKGIEKMVGLFINTIPVRIKGQDLPFSSLLQNVQLNALNSEIYSYYPLYEIQAQCELRQNLLDHIIVFENYPIDKEISEFQWNRELGISLESFEAFEQTNYPFNIIVVPGNELSVRLVYDENVYDSEFIKKISGHFNQVAQSVISNPEIICSEIEIVTDEEKHQLINGLNNTHADYPKDMTIHQLFEMQADKVPGKTAVIFQGEKLTYKMLNQKAN